MIEKLKRFSLPFEIISTQYYAEYLLLNTTSNSFLAKIVQKEELQLYHELTRISSHFSKAIYELSSQGEYLLVFIYDSLTEPQVQSTKLLSLLPTIFQQSSFEITLKKDHLIHLNHIYKVLDNKFSYFELRIREVETSPIKNDISWVLLSKYNIVLDAKLYLYDLQSDIFKAIDNKSIVSYGLIPKKIYRELYQKGHVLPFFDVYYGPISMLYARYFLSIEEIDSAIISKLDSFNKKYFCFMVLYIYILNLNMEIMLDHFSLDNYLLITKKIKSFIVNYKAILEG